MLLSQSILTCTVPEILTGPISALIIELLKEFFFCFFPFLILGILLNCTKKNIHLVPTQSVSFAGKI